MSQQNTWVKYDVLKEGRGRFVVSPLTKGMGNTLGNALRRVLLSSLSGAALTAVRIEGVTHEFSTIPNVVEDVLDIICNLKSIVFSLEGAESVELKLKGKGKGKLSAKDLVLPTGVTVINPKQHIVELADNGSISMILTLSKGVGYAPAEFVKEEGQAIDEISLDASFSPIVKVNHQVDSIRVGKELDNDQLTLDVWTNGSVDPEEAVKRAAHILGKMLTIFGKINEEPVIEKAEKESKLAQPSEEVLGMSIDDLELSARSSNCLKRAGIETVGELISKDMSELIQIKNFGKKSADEINSKLSHYNLVLKA